MQTQREEFDRLLRAKTADLARQMQRDNLPCFSRFLDGRERILAQRELQALHFPQDQYCFWEGFAADVKTLSAAAPLRCMLGLFPDYLALTEGMAVSYTHLDVYKRQASKVTIEIRQGGVTMIRVSDNGSGIAPEDVPMMFLRHATSKVRSREDLGCIATLGFRGEAMASIHAVSRIEVLTRQPDCNEGTRYVGEGSQTGQMEPAGCPVGTTVKVCDLFYNTPARMKFLKKDVQEGNAVAAVVERVALSHPEISFQFIREGQTRIHTPGDGKLLSAILSLIHI